MNELKKLSAQRLCLVMLAALFLLNIGLCLYSVQITGGARRETLRQASAAFAGNDQAASRYEELKSAQDAYRAAMKEWMSHPMEEQPVKPEVPYTYRDDLNDFEYMDLYYSNVVTAKDRYEAVRKLVLETERTIKRFQRSGYSEDAYSFRKLGKIRADYQRLEEPREPAPGVMLGWEEFFRYNGAWILSVGGGVMIGASAYTCEKRAGMTGILRASKKGRLRVALKKTAFLAASSLGFSLLLFLSSLFTCALSCGLSSPFMRLWQAPGWILCPYDVTVLGAALWAVLACALLTFAFSLSAALLSLVTGAALPAVIGSAAILFGEYYLLGKQGVGAVFNVLALTKLPGRFENAGYTELFSRPLCEAIPLYLSVSAFALIFVFFCCFLWTVRGIPYAPPSSVLKKKDVGRAHSVRLFPYEMRKVFTLPMLLLLSAALILRVGISLASFDGRLTFSEKRKAAYMEEYQGMTTEEMYDAVTARLENYADVLSKERAKEVSLAYAARQISFEEYSAFLRDVSQAESHNSTLKAFHKELGYLLDKQNSCGIETRPVRDEAVYRLYSADFDLILILLIVALFAGVGARETESGMLPVMRGTVNGRSRVFRAKLILTLSFCALTAALLIAVDLLTVFSRYDRSFLRYPIVCSMRFSHTDLPLTFGAYIALTCVCRFLFTVLFGAGVFALSHLTASTWICALAAAGTLLPYIVSRLGAPVPGLLDYTLLLSFDRLWLSASASRAPVVAAASMLPAVLMMPFLLILSAHKIKK